MKKILLCTLLATMFLTSCDFAIVDKSDLNELVTEKLEEAYFEGQRDYANGDKRIEFTSDSCWVWTKSPWDSGARPKFNPSIIHNKQK